MASGLVGAFPRRPETALPAARGLIDAADARNGHSTKTHMTTDPATVASPPANAAAEQLEALIKRHRGGASWFFWIAGLSLINSISHLSGSEWSFILGLGITQVIDGISNGIKESVSEGSHGTITAISFILDLLVAGIFVLWGVLSRKGMRWAYIIGMVLFALDGLIFLAVGDIIGIGFHAFALICIFTGFKACGQLQQIQAWAAAARENDNQTPLPDAAGEAS